jgi:hypothetical protein
VEQMYLDPVSNAQPPVATLKLLGCITASGVKPSKQLAV